MTIDEEMYYLSKYAIRDKNGKEVPDIINVTLNRPKVYADEVIAAINARHSRPL